MKNQYEILNDKGDIAILLAHGYDDILHFEYPITAVISGRAFSLVDACLGTWRVWESRSGKLYAYMNVTIDGKRKKQFLHRVVTEAPDNMVVHHIDSDDCLNCRDENLRLVTNVENVRHRRGANCRSTTGVAYVNTCRHGFIAYGVDHLEKRTKYLGWYKSLAEAIYVRAKYEVEHEFDSPAREKLMVPIFGVLEKLKAGNLDGVTKFITDEAVFGLPEDSQKESLRDRNVVKCISEKLAIQCGTWELSNRVTVAMSDDFRSAQVHGDMVVGDEVFGAMRFDLVCDIGKIGWFVNRISIM